MPAKSQSVGNGIDAGVGQNVGRSLWSLPLPTENEWHACRFVVEDGLLIPLVSTLAIAVVAGKQDERVVFLSRIAQYRQQLADLADRPSRSVGNRPRYTRATSCHRNF